LAYGKKKAAKLHFNILFDGVFKETFVLASGKKKLLEQAYRLNTWRLKQDWSMEI